MPAADTDWRPLYPFTSHELRLGGLRYHYVDEGSGRPLLFVHGNPTWSFHWRRLIEALRGGFRAVAPDHIGCGMSDKPQEYPYTLARHIENLVQLVEHLDLADVTLVAQDWGGPIGLGAALARPERFSRIVLFNTGAFPPPYVPLRIRICRTPLLGTPALRGLNLFLRAALVMTVEDRRCLTPAVQAGILAPYDSWANRVAIDGFVRDIPLARIEAGLPSLADRPALFIWGIRDWCFRPLCLERLIESFPNAEVHRLEDVGHWIVEEAHDRILPLLEGFLPR